MAAANHIQRASYFAYSLNFVYFIVSFTIVYLVRELIFDTDIVLIQTKTNEKIMEKNIYFHLMAQTEKEVFNFHVGKNTHFQELLSKLITKSKIEIFALGESTTEGRFPPKLTEKEKLNFRYQDQILHHFEQNLNHSNVKLTTIAGGGQGICSYSKNLFTNQEKILKQIENSDLIFIQTDSNDAPYWAGNVTQCMEDIYIRAKKNSIIFFLDFTFSEKHQIFYDTYDCSYVSLNKSSFFDGHHPDLITMNEAVLNIKTLIEKGFNQPNMVNDEPVESKFRYEDIRHFIFSQEIHFLSPLGDEKNLNWEKCSSPWPVVCRPKGWHANLKSSKIEFLLQFNMEMKNFIFSMELIQSYDEMGIILIEIFDHKNQEKLLLKKLIDCQWENKYSIPIIFDIGKINIPVKTLLIKLTPQINENRGKNKIQIKKFSIYPQ